MRRLKQNKALLRDYLRNEYSDDKLVLLLDHARSGQLSYMSCCCFEGLAHAKANHKIRGLMTFKEMCHRDSQGHDHLSGLTNASVAFNEIGYCLRRKIIADDSLRRCRIIPMILAEIARRAKLREETSDVFANQAFQSRT